jgi:hypothetical protein
VSDAVRANPAPAGHANRDTARRVVPLFRPYRAQVAAVVALMVVTSTIGVANPLLIQAVFNKALFVPDGPNIQLLVNLVSIMAVIPIVNGAIGILQVSAGTQSAQIACSMPSPRGDVSAWHWCRPQCRRGPWPSQPNTLTPDGNLRSRSPPR